LSSTEGAAVWLVRHGEARNPAGVLYGRLPRLGLSPLGQQQAQAVAKFLEPRPLAAIYSSPILRARKTAAAILACHPEIDRVRLDRDLVEIRTGWQGEPLATLEKINWDFYAHPRSPEDESIEMIHARMQRWLRRVLRRHTGREVVGVSHGDPILILVAGLRGLPLERQRIFANPYIEPATVFRLRFESAASRPEVQQFVPHAEAAA
jgi:probable phosphoglycerate mutase